MAWIALQVTLKTLQVSFLIGYYGLLSHAFKGLHIANQFYNFLTDKYTGTLLIASSQDGNRRIFPLVFPIVEGETMETCDWFFYNLRTFVTPQANICVISYRGTRLLVALRTQLHEWSNVESIYCICHLASNFNKEFRDPDLKDKVIKMGYELMRPRFERIIQGHEHGWTISLKQNELNATMKGDNMAIVLKGSRALPITALLQTTYYRLNLWFSIKENQRQSTCQLVRSFSRETGMAEVEAKVYTVKLTDNWCDCGEFQSLRLSCSHAIATCSNLNLDCGQFISPTY
ncbi:hypothetical protein Lal_00024766 [Lupinus albus]|nr:hypothetical protein Lal_00024766 [Lupinus albus]